MNQVWIAVIAALIMAGGLGGLYYLVIRQNAALDFKALQFASIVLVLPLLLALGVMNILRSDTIGPLIGVIVGYVLAGSRKE